MPSEPQTLAPLQFMKPGLPDKTLRDLRPLPEDPQSAKPEDARERPDPVQLGADRAGELVRARVDDDVDELREQILTHGEAVLEAGGLRTHVFVTADGLDYRLEPIADVDDDVADPGPGSPTVVDMGQDEIADLPASTTPVAAKD